jgi:hypothetical protein
VIKRGGHLLESPNAFTEGSDSVAESTMTAFQLIRDGRAKLETGVLYDHREAPPETDMADAESLLRGLAVAYGDSADVEHCAIHEPPCERPGWVDLEHIAASIWEPDADPQVSRSDWLNQVTHASNAWLSSRRGPRATATGRTPRSRRSPTATSSRSASTGPAAREGQAGRDRADRLPRRRRAPVRDRRVGSPGGQVKWPIPGRRRSRDRGGHRRRVPPLQVAAFYCDPAKDWRSFVNAWEAKYAARLVRSREGKQVTATVHIRSSGG